MILLTIRSDKPDSEIGLYDGSTQIQYETWPAHRQLAETLHIKIRQLLQKHDISLDEIEGIVVYKGPGSFTGLRIGISVANAMSYSLGVPIVGTQGDSWIVDGINDLQSGNNELPITPFYGSDANITTPRK